MKRSCSKRVKEQPHTEATLKKVAPSEEMDVNHTNEAPVRCQKGKVLENSQQGTDGQQSVPAVVGRTSVAAASLECHIKEELEDAELDIGPTVLQHMDSRYRTNQISQRLPAENMPGQLTDLLVDGGESGSGWWEIQWGVEDHVSKSTSQLPPSSLDSELPGTGLYWVGEDGKLTALTYLGATEPIPTSPQPLLPGTSRDVEPWMPQEEDAVRSRSPSPGTSRDSQPWEEKEAVTYEEEWLEEEEEEDEEALEALARVPEEMYIEEPAPRLNESVAWVCPSRRGAHSHRGRRAATYAACGEGGWRQGEPLIEMCASDADVPPRLKEVIDGVHDCNVRRELQKRRGVERDDDESHSVYDPESEQGLFGGGSTALNFDWSTMETFHGSPEKFLPETTGPVRNFSNAYDAFRTYWDDDILQHIVEETNRYAVEISSRSAQFAREWTDTNVDEIMILFAFWMMLGILKMPTLKLCFSQHPLLKTDIFRNLFTQRRYFSLNRALHFVDNSTRTPQSSRLFSLGPVLDHLKAAFMNAYTPGRDISIDKTLLWKGNLVFKQSIKTNAAKFSIKSFELCESATGYLWAFNIYTGKDTSGLSSSTFPTSTKAVLDLVTPLLNKGHRLFMNNWFNSPILARYLKRNGTDCVGMLRNIRLNVPPLVQCATLPRGHFIARHAGDVVVMAYQDTKTVYTISTCHGVDVAQVSARPGRPSHDKPAVIADYYKYMNRVDKEDQMLEPYLIERKRCQKWSRKLFKKLLNVSILNSRILLRQTSSDHSQPLVFRIDLVEEIVRRHLSRVPQPRQRLVSNNIPGLSDDRLLNPGQHFIVRASEGEGDGDGRLTTGKRTSKNRGLCQWCRVRDQRYTRIVYKCRRCDVYLCLSGCFEKYHTLRE